MPMGDPFSHLGISSSATHSEIRRAWRNRARAAHPDTGGSHEEMQFLNQILVAALAASSPKDSVSQMFVGARDVSSFTVAVLPVECYVALEVVAAMCGPTVSEEPPYMIEFMLHDAEVVGALNGWCRCDLVPEAGATTVSLLVGSGSRLDQPRVEQVRDYLVDALNSIDWPISE